MSETFQLKSASFAPEVLARIAPDLSLQRHLSLGVRPCLRAFEEFKTVQVHSKLDSINRYGSDGQVNGKSTTLGSANVKCGNTIVSCTISGGFVEELRPVDEIDENVKEYEKIYDQSKKSSDLCSTHRGLDSYRTVYPIVEIERGRSGPPTDEEMILSQTLCDSVLNARIIPKESLDINLGLKTVDQNSKVHIVYPQGQEDEDFLGFRPTKKYSFVLYASIQVFSRSGPLFDIVWLALLSALKSTRLPHVYFDEKNSSMLHDLSSLSSKNSVKNGTISARSSLQVVCDPAKSYSLKLNNPDTYATTVGVIKLDKEFKVAAEHVTSEDLNVMQVDSKDLSEDNPILICDIEGDAEESAIASRISVIPAQDSNQDNLVSLSVLGGGTKVTKDVLHKAIHLARLRSNYLLQL